MSVLDPLDVFLSWAASGARLGAGMVQVPAGPRPAERLVLYEFEGCPHCRRVREAVSVLDLEVELRPCPKRGPRFRPEVKAKGGKAQFPFLVDPNTGDALYESKDIVAHLFRHYGAGAPPWSLRSPLFGFGSSMASALRLGRGVRYRGDPAKAPAVPLELWGFESSPYTRLPREALCELELPYILHTTPAAENPLLTPVRFIKRELGYGPRDPETGEPEILKGSRRWGELKRSAGRAMVPYLIDPNTGAAMYESRDIRRYLFETYGG